MEIERLPELYHALHPFFQLLIILFLAFVGGELIRILLNIALRVYKRRTGDEVLTDSIIRNLRPVLKVLLPLILFNMALDTVDISEEYLRDAHKGMQILLICAFAWLVTQIIDVVVDLIYHNYDVEAADNYLARKVQTQVQFIKKALILGVIVLAISAILLSFEGVRNIGAGLLTSAGVTGIIIGFAAQKSIANLIAGLQIAFTQPIRLDDVVIVEGEWGRIEEITFTYVVVRIWDQRRLIVPIHYFIDKPFQNWTRSSADIMGTVFLYTDYHVPVDALREELQRLCKGSPYWDKKVAVVQVTDVTEQSVQIRALVSASTSGNAWELRVMVREKLIEFIRDHYPESLPRTRAELQDKREKGASFEEIPEETEKKAGHEGTTGERP